MPGACSRVVMNALCELQIPFDDTAVNIFRGEQRTPAYLALNPKGKVPALQVGDQVLTEAVAILMLLNEQNPGQLLPLVPDPVVRAQHLADLIWCSNTLHGVARSIFMPVRIAPGAEAAVREAGTAQLTSIVPDIEHRLGDGWWHGEIWSITDVYISWCLGVAAAGGFDLGAHPALVAHTERVRSRPSFERALDREKQALERHGIQLPPGARL
jgi:glutathione S-transferase